MEASEGIPPFTPEEQILMEMMTKELAPEAMRVIAKLREEIVKLKEEVKGLTLGADDEAVKPCGHKFPCGCGRETCKEMHGDDCQDDEDGFQWCEDEECKHYYDHRNDNCDCGGRDCCYCNPTRTWD